MDKVLTIIVPKTGPITNIYGLGQFNEEEIRQIIARLESVANYLKDKNG